MTQTVHQDTRKRRGWLWLLITGSVLLVLGITAGTNQQGGSLCGSVFSPDSPAAELYDTLQGAYGGVASCEKSIAAAAVPTWIFLGLGVVLILTGIIVRAIGNSRPAVLQVQPPSVASQLEDLSRLKEQGLLSPEEFEAKRVELLSKL